MISIKPGIKLAEMGIMPDVSDEELLFLKQLGVDYVEGRFTEKFCNLEDILGLQRKVDAAGLRLFSAYHFNLVNFVEIQLGLPGRYEKIKQFQNFIKNLGKAGIHTSTYVWMPWVMYSTGRAKTRGCDTRLFDLAEAQKESPAYGRIYTDEELWENYAYFIKKILPVAEDAGVRMALHPCDPPVSVRGIAQIFRNSESFKRAMEISKHSEYSGLCFCVGTWAEMDGSDGKGENIIGAIHHFGKSGRIFNVHFRNVISTLPRFHQTFIDNGYVDMYRVLKALREVNFNGTIVPDHVPECKDEKRVGSIKVSGTSYTIGYMRALLEAL